MLARGILGTGQYITSTTPRRNGHNSASRKGASPLLRSSPGCTDNVTQGVVRAFYLVEFVFQAF